MNRRDFMKVTSAGLVAGSLAPTSARSSMARNKFPQKFNMPYADEGELVFSAEEYKRRYSNIQAAMEEQGLDCLIITGNEGWYQGEAANLRYVMGAGIRLDPNFVVFPVKGEPVLLYKTSPVLQRTPDIGDMPLALEPSPVRAHTNRPDWIPTLVKLVKKMGYAKAKIGLVSERYFPADAYRTLQQNYPHATLVDAEQLMTDLRVVKSEEELKFLRRSGYCADAGIAGLIHAVEPGITEQELYYAADEAMAMAGGTPGGFHLFRTGPWKDFRSPPNVPNLEKTRYRKLKEGDVVMNELTSEYNGYFTQLAIPIVIGEPDPDFLKFIEVNKAMYDVQFEAFKTGATIGEVDKLGGGIASRLSNGKMGSKFACQTIDFEQSFWHTSPTLKPGISYVLMPWIHYNEPGHFSGHAWGNTLVCTDGSPEVLNQSPMGAVII